MTQVEKFVIYPIISIACFVSGYFTHLAFESSPVNQIELMNLQKDVKQIQQLLIQSAHRDDHREKLGRLD